ncbi:pseudouridine synthase [Gilvimarinus algae]|uniref:tRNA pseudouridine synthase C n=1 Tax=Gilvimarinus algae TaxID=3058037 RepID=A0ABT8TJ54_9GAMM|nr:pseudouridine synthase [Gilvimarinus sp. SDUM040014]MDO3384125.1 pseudouridine synthase [Gilvimarinus sp. SDUM040014]
MNSATLTGQYANARADKPLDIVFQDEQLIAINKPSGLLVHRSPIDKHETRFAIQLLRDQIGQRVYPAHRLDKPTSGVLLFALSPDTARALNEQWEAGLVQKQYLAIVRGHAPASARIDHALRYKRDDYGDADKSHAPLQSAITEVHTLAQVELPEAVDRYPSSRYSLVSCQPLTGRKHQLRRHLKHIGHPIIGDAKHGKSIHNHFFARRFGADRLLLAAVQLTLSHPVRRSPLTINAPLTGRFASVIEALGWQAALPRQWLAEQSHAAG